MTDVDLTQKTYFYAESKVVISTWLRQDGDGWVWSAVVDGEVYTDDETYVNQQCAFANARLWIEGDFDIELGVRDETQAQ